MAVLLTALGFGDLETILQGSPERTAAHIETMTYFFGAVLLVAAEAMSLTDSEKSAYPIIHLLIPLLIGIPLLWKG